jgi:hypothetical protein
MGSFMGSVRLLLLATLLLVAPTSGAILVDLHGGEAFHPVFPHPHPSAPTSDDPFIAVPVSQVAIQGAHATDLSGWGLTGELVAQSAGQGPTDHGAIALPWASEVPPGSLSSGPLDPPPKPV